MKHEQLLELLAPSNAWWKECTDWRNNLPGYRRPIVDELLADIRVEQASRLFNLLPPGETSETVTARLSF